MTGAVQGVAIRNADELAGRARYRRGRRGQEGKEQGEQVHGLAAANLRDLCPISRLNGESEFRRIGASFGCYESG